MVVLWFVAFVLMSWLLLAARSTNQFQYYIWSLLVAVLWSQAAYARDPKRYGNLVNRLFAFGLIWVVVLGFILGVYYVIENPEFLQNIIENVDEATPTPEPASSLIQSILVAFAALFP
ncbi:MAG: hypothetical protein JXB38_13755 [Anaerolineales bacterium]|nr:hypothetical protein [Anaerolineales bacterium]